jgi:hypothetical protein
MSLNHHTANSKHRSGNAKPRIHGVRAARNGRPDLLHRLVSAVEHGALSVYMAETYPAKGA